MLSEKDQEDLTSMERAWRCIENSRIDAEFAAKDSGFSMMDSNGRAETFVPVVVKAEDLSVAPSPREQIDAEYHGYPACDPEGYPLDLDPWQALEMHCAQIS